MCAQCSIEEAQQKMREANEKEARFIDYKRATRNLSMRRGDFYENHHLPIVFN